MRTFYKDKAPLSINPVFNMEFLDTCQQQPLYLFSRQRNRKTNRSSAEFRSRDISTSLKSIDSKNKPMHQTISSNMLSYMGSKSKFTDAKMRSRSYKKLMHQKTVRENNVSDAFQDAVQKKLTTLKTPDDNGFKIIIRKYRAY